MVGSSENQAKLQSWHETLHLPPMSKYFFKKNSIERQATEAAIRSRALKGSAPSHDSRGPDCLDGAKIGAKMGLLKSWWATSWVEVHFCCSTWRDTSRQNTIFNWEMLWGGCHQWPHVHGGADLEMWPFQTFSSGDLRSYCQFYVAFCSINVICCEVSFTYSCLRLSLVASALPSYRYQAQTPRFDWCN